MGSFISVERVHGQMLPGTWTMKSPLSAVRAEVAAVALDGRLHALGGSLDGKAGSYRSPLRAVGSCPGFRQIAERSRSRSQLGQRKFQPAQSAVACKRGTC